MTANAVATRNTPANGGGIYDWVTSMLPGAQDWFGPGEPLTPQAQRTAGRRFDYPTSFNIGFAPARDGGVSFRELRALADGYDLLRLAIETRKDEMELLEWRIQEKGGRTTDASKRLHGFLASPDREHTWHQWMRMLLEELFVTDAPALYVRRTMGGDPYSLEPVDGATIKRLLDETGRTPETGPAYQQVLKGVVTANFDRTELIYCPRNLRVNRVYGYSPVEQVMTTVNIALRRQQHQLSYYTEGSVPDLLFQVPEGWDAKQIQEFQTWWGSLFSEGNVANRRMARFVPHGVTPYNTKDAALKDQYDEWLARIICFAFSISPNALVAQVNRATAEQVEETAKGAGLEPIKQWLKGLMDRIIAEVYGEPGLEFTWLKVDDIDPNIQAQIHVAYVQCGVMDVNEVREAIGLEARKEPPPTPARRIDDGWQDADIVDAEVVQEGQPALAAPQVPGGAAVQDTALNGAQVSSLVQIIESVTSGILPKESAIQLIQAAFPSLSDERVRGIINPLEDRPKAPAPEQTAPQSTGNGSQGAGGEGAAVVAPSASQNATTADQGGKDGESEKMAKGRACSCGCGSANAPGCGCGNADAPLAKVRRTPITIDHGRKAIKAITAELQRILEGVFARQRDAAVERLRAAVPELGKADWTSLFPDFDAWFEAVSASVDKGTMDAILLQLERAAKSGGTVALNQLRQHMKDQTKAAYDHMVNQVNWRAVEWAKDAAAELVTNIDGTTRESIKNLVSSGVERGLSVDELAAELSGAHAFSRERAELIAVTELAEADVTGNKMAYAESGVVGGLQWVTANGGTDERTCEECEMNHGAVVPMGADGMAAKPYPSGAMGVPAHPRCICDEIPVLKEDV